MLSEMQVDAYVLNPAAHSAAASADSAQALLVRAISSLSLLQHVHSATINFHLESWREHLDTQASC